MIIFITACTIRLARKKNVLRTFPRRARSLATYYIFARVRIHTECFYVIGDEVSYENKNCRKRKPPTAINRNTYELY